jgi:hypothetical protein
MLAAPSKGFGWCTKSLVELCRVINVQVMPWNELRQLDPAIVIREFAAKWQEEIFERELITMITPLYVENSCPLLGQNRPFMQILTSEMRWRNYVAVDMALFRKP